LDYNTFMRLRGCTSCIYFPGPYLKAQELESPEKCFNCWDSLMGSFTNYRRKKYI
jgi:hypothetical protein